MTPTPSNPDLAAALPEADLLPICPVCGYSLHLQPIQHRCPECGFEFDRRGRVFGERFMPNRRGVGLSRLWFWTIVFTLSITLNLCGLLAAGRVHYGAVVLVGMGVLLLGYLWRPARTQFIVVDTTGVRLMKGSRCLKRFDWDEIKSAWLDLDGRYIRIRGAGDAVLCSLSHFNDLQAEVDRCVAAINNYPRPTKTEQTLGQPT